MTDINAMHAHVTSRLDEIRQELRDMLPCGSLRMTLIARDPIDDRMVFVWSSEADEAAFQKAMQLAVITPEVSVTP